MSLDEKREEKTIEWEFGIEWFKDLQSKVKYNIYQSEYYERMADDYHNPNYLKKAERTLSCSKVWDSDFDFTPTGRIKGSYNANGFFEPD